MKNKSTQIIWVCCVACLLLLNIRLLYSIYYDNNQVKNYLQAIKSRATENGITVYQDNSNNPKVAVVVIGEESYTHGTQWADKNPNIPEEQLSVIREFHEAGVKVIMVVISQNC